MYKQSVKLNNDDGSFRCYITQSEARRGVKAKNMRRLRIPGSSALVYQLIKQAPPSNSPNDIPTITVRDLLLTVGIQRIGSPYDEKRVYEAEQSLERLIGFGLIPENTPLPASGYL